MRHKDLKLKTDFSKAMHKELNELAAAAGEEMRNASQKVTSDAIFQSENGEFAKSQELFAYFLQDFEILREKYWHKMNNETSFLTDCFNKLRYATRTYDINKGNFMSRIEPMIKRVVGDHCTRRGDRRELLESRDALLHVDEDESASNGRDPIYTDIDPNANVQEEAIETARETELIEKYGDNDRNKAIMEIIMDEKQYIKQADIARRLADKLSISFDSARGSVRTFIKNMKEGITTNDYISA